MQDSVIVFLLDIFISKILIFDLLIFFSTHTHTHTHTHT